MQEIAKTAEKIAEILDNKKAQDIIIIDLDGLTIIADYFVVASASSTTHVQTLADEVQAKMSEECGRKPMRVEGEREGRWIVLDYQDVLVHLFHTEEREFYQLERLWKVEDNFYDYADGQKKKRSQN
ncbi:ribosome silencing factor [Christensenellaceae bacterium OttesenSCG-928-K19]|nr:ribosome silencing factor [Christensenellaceae bacterium OttesenSCG-928-K19]